MYLLDVQAPFRVVVLDESHYIKNGTVNMLNTAAEMSANVGQL